MSHKITFTCDNCGNTTFVTRYDDERDCLIECLACEEYEPIMKGENNWVI
jgi:DNA replicative helicase MCM subunit Mcm2 (Cdc46/Mcm family)